VTGLRPGLRGKIFGALFLTTLVSLALVYGLTSQVHLAGQEEEELSRGAALARILASGLESVDLEDTQAVDGVLGPLKQDAGVVGLFVLRGSGFPIAEEDEGLLSSIIPLPDVLLFLASNQTSRLVQQKRPDGSMATLVASYAPIGDVDERGTRRMNAFVVLSVSQRMERVELSNQFVLLSMGLGLIVVLMLGYLTLGRLVVHRVQNLVRISKKIGGQEDEKGGQFGEHGDELGHLEHTLNQMHEELKQVRLRVQVKDRERQNATEKWKVAEESLERSERLASLGVLTAGFAHEIGNPMGVLQGYLELLQDPTCTPEERLQFMERMQEAITAMDRVLRELLRYSRPSPRTEGAEQTDLHDVTVAVLHCSRWRVDSKGVRVSWAHEEHPIWVEADRGRLEQVLMNLLLNAGDAMGGDGEVSLQAEESGPYWNLHVVDSGPGIPEEVLPHLFDPFFTTKEEGVGTGLGLAISRRIVNSCGGDIHAQNAEGTGARFTIRLYRASQDSLNE